MKRFSVFLSLLVICAVMAAPVARAGYMRGDHYTLDEIYTVIKGMEKKNPDLVSVSEFGKSVEADGKDPWVTSLLNRMDFLSCR